MVDNAQRGEMIDQWLENYAQFPWFNVQADTERRVYDACRRVLGAMPAEDFQRFMGATPMLWCQESVNAATLPACLSAAPPPDPESDWPMPAIIYLGEPLATWSEDKLVFIFAHESAHVVLNHHDLRKRPPFEQAETDADQMGRRAMAALFGLTS